MAGSMRRRDRIEHHRWKCLTCGFRKDAAQFEKFRDATPATDAPLSVEFGGAAR